MNGWPKAPAAVVRLMRPSVVAAMSAIPDDSPSSPSMKLMLLIIPTIQTIVNATANASPRTIAPGPTGLCDAVHGHTEGDRDERHRELAEELPPRADLEDVVEEADGGRCEAADEQRAELRGANARRDHDRADRRAVDQDHHDDRDREEGRGDRQATGPRDRAEVDPARVRPVDEVERPREAPDRRGQHERQQGGRRERDG